MVKVNRLKAPVTSIEVCSTLKGEQFGGLTFDTNILRSEIGVRGNPSFNLSKAEAQDLVDALQELVNQLQ